MNPQQMFSSLHQLLTCGNLSGCKGMQQGQMGCINAPCLSPPTVCTQLHTHKHKQTHHFNLLALEESDELLPHGQHHLLFREATQQHGNNMSHYSETAKHASYSWSVQQRFSQLQLWLLGHLDAKISMSLQQPHTLSCFRCAVRVAMSSCPPQKDNPDF